MRFRLLASLLLAAMLGLLSGCTLLATATTGPLIDQHLPANYSGVAAVRKDAASPLVVRARAFPGPAGRSCRPSARRCRAPAGG